MTFKDNDHIKKSESHVMKFDSKKFSTQEFTCRRIIHDHIVEFIRIKEKSNIKKSYSEVD